MDNASIFARIAGGFAIRAAAIGAAIYVASAVWDVIRAAFAPVAGVL